MASSSSYKNKVRLLGLFAGVVVFFAVIILPSPSSLNEAVRSLVGDNPDAAAVVMNVAGWFATVALLYLLGYRLLHIFHF